MRSSHLFGLVLGVAVTVVSATARDARACGGCIHEPPKPNPPPNEIETMVTDHRMILSISAQQTTLYDQVKYVGNPASFAWVLPISGTVKIGLSSDAMFAALDQATETIISAPPPPVCPPPPSRYCPSNYCPQPNCPGDRYGSAGSDGGSSQDGSAGSFGDSASADSGPPPVTITMQETVGPYETVQLHSTDPMALEDWLVSHGFAIPDDVRPIIAAYVAEHFDFLAMKLVPGAGVQAMRPVRVTWPGATTVLPLRMVGAGTGATVGVGLWIVAEGRYEPQNFPWFVLGANDLTWDYRIQRSDYTTLRAQKEAALGGRGWHIESSDVGPINTVISALSRPGASMYCDPVKNADGGVVESSDQARSDDLQALLGGIPFGHARVTRMRSDLAHAALATDIMFQASADQSTLPSTLFVTRNNAPACPVYPDPPPCPAEPPACPPVTPCPPSVADGFANGAAGESFSCASTATPASPEALGSFVILAGIVVFRMRRRRAR